MPDKLYKAITLLNLVLLLVLTARSFWPERGKWTGVQQRDLAVSLKAMGLPLPAATEFQRYLELFPVGAEERTGLYATIGDIHYGLMDYGKALAFYLRAESLDRSFKGRGEVPSRIVDCLERLGRKEEARAARNRYTSINPALAVEPAAKAAKTQTKEAKDAKDARKAAETESEGGEKEAEK